MYIFKFLIALVLCLPFSALCAKEDTLSAMSTQQKVAQLLLVHFVGEEANDEARILINEIQVGGIIYYNWANGLNSPTQISTLSNELQALSKKNKPAIPLFIAIDQEGGVVTRLPQGFTIFPGNRALAMTNKPALIKSCAYASGKELQAVGINLNFAPSVDVNDNPQNPIIGLRSFGSDPHLVAKYARELMHGYKEAGIITALNHFPGHGNASVDSHDSLPTISKTKEQLEQTELLPFRLLTPIADMVMTGHLLVPALDPHNCATFSKPILDLLRDEMGYEGIIISDSMIMQGLIEQSTTLEEAAIKAITAGCDILVLGGKLLSGKHHQNEISVTDIRKIHMALVTAVEQGIISHERLDSSVSKILKLKATYRLSHMKLNSDLATLKAPWHLMLATQVASEALRVVKDDLKHDLLLNSKVTIICPKLLEEELLQSTFLQECAATILFISLEPSEEEIQQCLAHASHTQHVLFFSYNAWRYQKQAALMHALIQPGSRMQLICLRDPQDSELLPDANDIIITFSPTLPSIDAALKRLINEHAK